MSDEPQFVPVDDFHRQQQPFRCVECGETFTREESYVVLMCEREGCAGELPAVPDVEVVPRSRVSELEVELARTREALKELVRLKDAEEGKAVLAYSFDAWGNARAVISSPARSPKETE